MASDTVLLWEDVVLLIVFALVVVLVLWAPVLRFPCNTVPHLAQSRLFRALFLQQPPWPPPPRGDLSGTL